MSDIFAKLGIKAKTYVGISVSPTVGVEMIEIDRMTNKVLKYSNRPLNYNISTREIVDYNEFQNIVINLFDELHISSRGANVIVNLPNVHFGFTYLPSILSDDAVTQAIISDVEQSYLFKRKAPVVSWSEINTNSETNNKYIVYTAIQEEAVNNIKEIFDELGAKLVAIENAYSSMFKALEYTGLIDEQIRQNDTWNLLLVTANSYTVFNLMGSKILEYYEDPLAIKSFTNEEVYVAIASAASATLNNYPASRLLIISETNEVSAEILSMQLKFSGQKEFLERNVYSKDTFINVDFSVLPNYVPSITLEAVGAAIYMHNDFNLKFNLLQGSDGQEVASGEIIYLFGQPIEISKNLIRASVGILILVIVVTSLIINAIIGHLNKKMTEDIDSTNSQISKLEEQIKLTQHKTGFVDIYTAVANINQQNRKEMQYYDALSVDIPQKLWITYFYSDASDAVAIKGKAISVDDIYTYFRNVKNTVSGSDLTLTKLTVSDSLGGTPDPVVSGPNDIYDFQLTNSKFNDGLMKLGAPAKGQQPVDPNNPNAQPMGSQAIPPGVPTPPSVVPPLQQIN